MPAKPGVSQLNTLAQRGAALPAQPAESGNIAELSGRAVGPVGIIDDPALIAHDVFYQPGQFPDADVFARADIDDRGVVIILHEKDGRLGQVIHIQKFPAGPPGTPDFHRIRPPDFGLVEFPEQGRQHMRTGQAEIIPRPVEIGWHQRDGVEAVLSMVGLAQFKPGNLGDGIPLVGCFQRAAEQIVFLYRLRAVARIDAGGAQKGQFFCAISISRFHNMRLYQQIVAQKLNGPRGIGLNAAHHRGGVKDIFRPGVRKKPLDPGLNFQVQFGMGAGNEVVEFMPLQIAA